MAITITGKLNKAANEFQAGDSTGFGIRLGVQYYDRETESREWTNYECAVFSNNANQVDFLRNNLIKGAVIEVTGQQAKIKTFDGQQGQSHSIELIDAKLGYVHSGTQDSQQSAPQNSQQAPSQSSPLGYYFADGSTMKPDESNYYIQRGARPWAKGTVPPVYA